MKHYLKLYIEYTKINLKSIAIYDKDFVFGIFAMGLKNILNLIQVFFIFKLTSSISGWSVEQMVLLYSGAVIAFSVWRCFFIHTMSIPYFVKNGEMDIFLIKPLGTLFQIMVYGFDEDAWGDLAVGILIFCVSIYSNNIGLVRAIILFFLFSFSSLIFISISLIFSSLTIRTNGEMDFSSLNYVFADISKYPITIFNDKIRFILTYIIPIGNICYYPIIYTLLNMNFNGIIIYIISTLFFFSCSYLFWKMSFKTYSSTGS